MPKKKTVRKTTPKRDKAETVTYNQFFGMLLIAVGIGALIVFLRYLVITWVTPADVYLIEPSQLVPGMQ